MDKKYIKMGVIIILILLLIIGAYFIYNSGYIKIGNNNFKIPEGYSIEENEKYINLTNGTDSICLNKVLGKDIESSVNNYIKLKKSQNLKVNTENYSFNGNNIIKLYSLNETNTEHYYFEENGLTYDIFTCNKNNNTALLVNELIQTKKSAIL